MEQPARGITKISGFWSFGIICSLDVLVVNSYMNGIGFVTELFLTLRANY